VPHQIEHNNAGISTEVVELPTELLNSSFYNKLLPRSKR
jgi:hypothetical protein